MEFFYLERSGYAGESGQLRTSYFIQDHYFSDLDTRYSEDMTSTVILCFARKLKSLKDLAILTSRRLFLLKRFTLFIGKRHLHTYHVEGAANARRWEMEKNMEPTGTIC